ncbi:MAG: hypothetical protein P8182_13040, partial [Deltaproteobacteria bacterium]
DRADVDDRGHGFTQTHRVSGITYGQQLPISPHVRHALEKAVPIDPGRGGIEIVGDQEWGLTREAYGLKLKGLVDLPTAGTFKVGHIRGACRGT